MKSAYFKGVVFALFASVLLLSCSKDKKKTGEIPTVKVVQLDTRDYETWTYFSFEKGIIGVYKEGEFDYKNSLDWDLAFHRWDVRTNSGVSGKGKGGSFAANYGGLDIETWSSTMPGESEFTKDVLAKTYMKKPVMDTGMSGDQRVEVGVNSVLSTWMNVVMSIIPPEYNISKSAFLVRTANGKLAAIRFLDYMNDKAEKGYPKFEYIYPIN